MNEISRPSPPRQVKRRWFSYSLRTGLLLVTITACWLGWLVPRARSQKASVEWVQSFGRQPRYAFQFDANSKFLPNAVPPGPKWLRELLGIDFLSSVQMVNLDECPVDDISPVASFHGLKHFELANGNFSNVSPLSGLTKLEHLSIGRNPISDISSLTTLTNLRRFYAYETNIRDLSVLSGMKKLENLAFLKVPIDDLTPLANLGHLKMLWLDGTNVSDLSPLARLTELTDLKLSETPVADITPLMNLQNLAELDLSKTKVPPAEIDKLEKQLPNCKIIR